jgi:hypothetical protein
VQQEILKIFFMAKKRMKTAEISNWQNRIGGSQTPCKQNASPLQDHCKGLVIWMQAE